MIGLPPSLPDGGLGEEVAAQCFTALIEAGSADLGAPDALAHMDPPAAAVSVRLAGLVARMNQNLLHPATSPFASEAERLVFDWIAPTFGMTWGHMCSGSTIANLTGLWAAREAGAIRVVSSADAHVSIAKSAHVLGMEHHVVPVDSFGRLMRTALPDLSQATLVLTAGTTGRGVIDSLATVPTRWLHVDAAWGGPLRFTRHAHLLDGIEAADSIAISAHKWLFQPKGSALVLFRDRSTEQSISFGTSYLARPNVGVEGSRGAAAVLLLATLLAWGRSGLAERIENCVSVADTLAERLESDPRVRLRQHPETGVVNWCTTASDHARVLSRLVGTSSSVMIDGQPWLRQVAANPSADVEAVWSTISLALQP